LSSLPKALFNRPSKWGREFPEKNPRIEPRNGGDGALRRPGKFDLPASSFAEPTKDRRWRDAALACRTLEERRYAAGHRSALSLPY